MGAKQVLQLEGWGAWLSTTTLVLERRGLVYSGQTLPD